jgi:hypothetical protein
MNTDEKRLLLEKKIRDLEEVIRAHVESRKIESWVPWPHQQRALDFIHAGKKVVLVQGGNRIGKTVFGACLVGSLCLGIQPWDSNPTVFGKIPIRARIIAVDWEHHAKEVIVPALKEWLPTGTYETRKNNVGVETYWDFKETKSTIELMTHSQETRIHEGWKGHIVWSDEPLPKDKYTANKRGLIDYSGLFVMTMTALYEPWILDEVVLATNPSVGCILDVPMRANPLLRDEDIKNFAAGLTEEEKAVRIDGGWLQLSGLILKNFDKDKNIVKDFEVPVDWPVIAVVDIHLSKPQAIGFYAWDKWDRMFAVEEVWEHLTPEQIGDEIVKRKFNYPRMKEVYIDPLAKGDNIFVQNRINIEDTYKIIEKKLAPFGIRLHIASKDKDSGVRNLTTKLSGLNGMPALFFLERCKRHIYEARRWIYDKDGKPQKENDHFMECLYRGTLTGTKYTTPGLFSGPLKYEKSGVV